MSQNQGLKQAYISPWVLWPTVSTRSLMKFECHKRLGQFSAQLASECPVSNL